MQEPTRFENLTIPVLAEHVVQRREGQLLASGAIAVTTGRRTGRSPKDRFIVCDDLTRSTVDWGDINQPFEPEAMDRLWTRVRNFVDRGDTYYRGLMHVGAHPDHYVPVQVTTQFAWHQMFASSLFLVPDTFNPENRDLWQILNAPLFVCDPTRDGTKSDGTVIIDFSEKRVLVAGMHYAGEMKKAMFGVLNFLLPDKDILPMHCSANVDANGKVALFFGLSGTGKTTLSSDVDCLLIGDDEHGWGTGTVFNFEGGCYAKCINLKRETEPVIFDAIRFGALLENVVIDEYSREPDFTDSSLTENTRACYPRDNIQLCVPDNRAGEPETIIFLTCDVSGVLPPVSLLSLEGAAYHFLSGYTAQVGSTVVGASEPYTATFSAGFGAAFLPRPPRVYAELLMRRINAFGANVYLVNTGWTGGAFGVGCRMSIPDTRRIINAVRSGELLHAPTNHLPELNLTIPVHIEGVDPHILNPRDGWSDANAYDAARSSLITKFKDNFTKFDIGSNILDAGPT
ncbi:MAG: phosphoenolpyruvate carboxykinase (ATP) [Gammaproteobacteria bacterium]|nr:phosphoenolpyruvate carboxykinase (ATP) [Gammaproteobacteria bacterium]MYF37738.1 phosphoenolpyruvate carboxykinase (ATP) [Gammaproteobacteria bacterium]